MQPNQVFEAIEFAAHAHAGQYRKGTLLPYIIHPLSVARILIEQKLDEHIVVAGILHDTLEDTEVSQNELLGRFGDRVANLVASVSEYEASESWEVRKRNTIHTIETASDEIVWIECADKLDNIRSMVADLRLEGESFWSRFNRPKEHQSWYYHALARAFRSRSTNDSPHKALVDEFERNVIEIFGPVVDSNSQK